MARLLWIKYRGNVLLFEFTIKHSVKRVSKHFTLTFFTQRIFLYLFYACLHKIIFMFSMCIHKINKVVNHRDYCVFMVITYLKLMHMRQLNNSEIAEFVLKDKCSVSKSMCSDEENEEYIEYHQSLLVVGDLVGEVQVIDYNNLKIPLFRC